MPATPQTNQFLVGVPNELHVIFNQYLNQVHDAEIRGDPALRRGYVLVRLIYAGDYVSIASLFRYCHEQEFKCPTPCKKYPFVIDRAVAMGHLPLVQFLHEHDFGKASPQAMDTAAAAGDLDLVEYLHTHRTEGCTREAFELAKKHNHRAVVEFLNVHRAADRELANHEKDVQRNVGSRGWQLQGGQRESSGDCVVQ